MMAMILRFTGATHGSDVFFVVSHEAKEVESVMCVLLEQHLFHLNMMKF